MAREGQGYPCYQRDMMMMMMMMMMMIFYGISTLVDLLNAKIRFGLVWFGYILWHINPCWVIPYQNQVRFGFVL